MTLNNLAIAYDYAGRLEEAIALYEQALAGLENGREPRDPSEVFLSSLLRDGIN